MARGALTMSALTQHDSKFIIGSSRFYPRVRFWTLSGKQCGPAGLGSETPDSDERLTCRGHLTVETVLGMRHWHRFAEEEDKVVQIAAKKTVTWWCPLEITVKSFSVGKGDAGRVVQ